MLPWVDNGNRHNQGGYCVSFVASANNGVTCGRNFVRNTLFSFLDGKSMHTGLTDPNHNVKNSRYQMLIGGNTAKTIGSCLIDTGLLPESKIAKELWQVKDFASDLLVLRLASTKKVKSFMSLPVSDTKSMTALCVTLFFMQVH